jgi:uncharacterized protein YndB with AHSA1/START domain
MIAKHSAATTLTTPSDREIVVTRVVNAPRRLVFEVYTNPAHVTQWMTGPAGWIMPICEIDLRPGGAWRFVWRRDDGTEMATSGRYTEIVPPERLVSTESWGGAFPEMLNTLLLSEQDGKTTITQRLLFSSKEARDAALKTGMLEGMSATYEHLDDYLATIG